MSRHFSIYDNESFHLNPSFPQSTDMSMNKQTGLRVAIIAPDSLQCHATELHQSFINVINEQKSRKHPSLNQSTDQTDSDCSSTHSSDRQSNNHPFNQLDETDVSIDQVSLYVQFPDESASDFILRLQLGAVPAHLRHQSINQAVNQATEQSSDHFADFGDDFEDGEDGYEFHDEDDQPSELSINQFGHFFPAQSEQCNNEEQIWRPQQSISQSSNQSSSQSDQLPLSRTSSCECDHEPHNQPQYVLHPTDSYEDEDDQPVHHQSGDEYKQSVNHLISRVHYDEEDEKSGHSATNHSSNQLTNQSSYYVHDDSDQSADQSSDDSIPPLDLSQLIDRLMLTDSCWHVNCLLYDGQREDIAFAYFQFMQCLAQQVKLTNNQSNNPSNSPLPFTVLVLHHAWSILRSCDADEESEERVKKLLNLADVVVVNDEQLVDAYQQLCPHVVCVDRGLIDSSANQSNYVIHDDGEDEDSETDESVDQSIDQSIEDQFEYQEALPEEYAMEAPQFRLHRVIDQTISQSIRLQFDTISPSRASTISESSCSPSNNQASTSLTNLMYSSIPGAPQCSPAVSPPMSPRMCSSLVGESDHCPAMNQSINLSTYQSLYQSNSPAQKAMDSIDLHSIIAKRRHDIDQSINQSINIHVDPSLSQMFNQVINPTQSVTHSHHRSIKELDNEVVVIGSFPIDDEVDESYSLSYTDCIKLFRATKNAILSNNQSNNQSLRSLFLIAGLPAPIQVSDPTSDQPSTSPSDEIVTLSASFIESQYNQAFDDLSSYKEWLFVQSVNGTKLISIHGIYTHQSVWLFHASLIDIELKLSRSVQDGGWCCRRVHASVPVLLDFAHSLALQRNGVKGVYVRRIEKETKQSIDQSDNQSIDQSDNQSGSDDDDDEKHPHQSHHYNVYDPFSDDLNDCLFDDEDGVPQTFSCAPHMDVEAEYDFERAAADLLPFIASSELRTQTCSINQSIVREKSVMEAVAVQFVKVFTQFHSTNHVTKEMVVSLT